MHNHLALILVLATTVLIGGLKTYNDNREDWCGIRLLPRVALERVPAVVLIIIIYLHFVHVFPASLVNERYAVLFYTIAGVSAELVVYHFLYRHGISLVRRRIGVKRMELAERLERDPNCCQILRDAIQCYGLKNEVKDRKRKERDLIKEFNTLDKPNHEQILNTIILVGVAHIKDAFLYRSRQKEVAQWQTSH